MSSPRIKIIGVGCHPGHLNEHAREALESCDYVIAAAKSDDDELLGYRRDLCDSFGIEIVAVPDPRRDRSPSRDYPGAVAEWHAERADAWREIIRERGGIAGFLVWGDPSLYDSTIRVVQSLGIAYDVVPGISAPQLLAARHKIVLHEIGRPLLITTGRRLPLDARHHDNLVVMLDGGFAAASLEGEWQVWWGANLGTDSEELVAGPLAEVCDWVLEARARAKEAAGWVMDVYLLQR